MTVSRHFNDELATVDAGKSFSYVIDSTHGENEWSVSGYTITGGSDAALEHGASEALHALGYRFWTPQKVTRPGSLPPGGANLARQSILFPYMRMMLNYGFGQGNADPVQVAYDRWAILNNVHDFRRPVGHAWEAIINAIDAEDGFFANNPSYRVKSGSTTILIQHYGTGGAVSDRRSCLHPISPLD